MQRARLTLPRPRDQAERSIPWDALPCDRTDERVGPGTELLSQGFLARHVIVVHGGLVKLVHAYPDGRGAIVGLRWSHSLLGACATLLEIPQPVSAIAITPCDLSRVPATRLTSLLKEGGPLSWRVHQAHAKEVVRECERAAELACLSARERLESFLGRIMSELAPATSDAIELPLRDWELAQFLAITPQYMSRLMHELVRQGRLHRSGNRWLLSEQPSGGMDEKSMVHGGGSSS